MVAGLVTVVVVLADVVQAERVAEESIPLKFAATVGKKPFDAEEVMIVASVVESGMKKS